MTVGSLFSGIGGFDLGLERAGMRVEWQVENNEFCREVLKKHWPKVPCHYDITHIDWRDIPRVDLICGGFPCQPFSLAGKRRGAADDRYLWPEVVRCLDVLRPTWFLGENVPGLINLALDQVCTDLESLGYAVWPVCVPACAVDAPHIRQRVWIVAHGDKSGLQRSIRSGEASQERASSGHATQCGGDVADATRELPHGCRARGAGWEESTNSGSNISYPTGRSEQSSRSQCDEWGFQDQTMSSVGHQDNWSTEPAVGRVAHGVPSRVDRLRGLGNAVVPQIVEALGRMILMSQQEAP